MAVIAGDICDYQGKRWVCIELQSAARGWPPDAVLRRPTDDGRYTTLVVHSDGPELISHPVLEIGQRVVVHDGCEGTILADDGGRLVQVSLTRRRQSAAGEWFQTTGVTDADRAQLIVDNFLS